MSIRAEDRPNAFATRFFSATGILSQYGDFDFQPGVKVKQGPLTEI